MKRAEFARRKRITCPGCGRPGTLVVGRGLYPYVEHCYEREIKAGGRPECWIPRDTPEVLDLLAQPHYAVGGAA